MILLLVLILRAVYDISINMDINVKTDISYVNVCIFSWNIQSNNIIFAGNLINLLTGNKRLLL